VIDEELVRPEAFALAVSARASYLARATLYEARTLRPYAQLTLLLGIELDLAASRLKTHGLSGAYRWAVTYGQPEGLPARLTIP
jgi:hypothetical protein